MPRLQWLLFAVIVAACALGQPRNLPEFRVTSQYLADVIAAEGAPARPGVPAGAPTPMTVARWNDLVDRFNVDGLALQLQIVGASSFQITVGRNYFMSPSAGCDQCSRRDLIADIASMLSKRGIRLMVSAPLDPPATLDQQKWQHMIAEWSKRWGRGVSGWSFDGPGGASAEMIAAARAGNASATVGAPGALDVPLQANGMFSTASLDRMAAQGHDLGRIPSVPQFQSNLPVNFDESKVGAYTLPDVMRFSDGTRVKTAKDWPKRRAEILKLFEANIYGHAPPRPANLKFEVSNPEPNVRKIILDFGTPKVEMMLFLPPNAPKPVPVLLQLSFSLNDSPAIAAAAERVIGHGYGLATIHYTEFQPDSRDGLPTGVRALAPNYDWGTIAAWAWGYSRAMDYLVTDRAVDAKRVAITGMSRLGKTVLWAGAQDQRFAMVWANCSGEGGAALARRNYGETALHMGLNFGYQYTPKYREFGENVNAMPTDQHELLALIAPRPLYLATAEDDKWSDPRGEFLSAVAAGPVWQLFGKHGLGTTEMPPLNTPIMHDIGYHYRNGRHEIALFDWESFLKFMDMHWNPEN